MRRSKTKGKKMIENSILPPPQLSQTLREWPLIWQPVWYAELPARATTPLWSQGSNHWGRCYQTGCWGNTLSLSLWRWVLSEKQMCTGGKKITKCSQAHRKRDGPERCLIKVKWIQYQRHRRRTAWTQRAKWKKSKLRNVRWKILFTSF